MFLNDQFIATLLPSISLNEFRKRSVPVFDEMTIMAAYFYGLPGIHDAATFHGRISLRVQSFLILVVETFVSERPLFL